MSGLTISHQPLADALALKADLVAGKVPSSQLPSASSGSVPAGVICMWGGLVSAIPSGWSLCDGTGGTPDLRSKFIKGAAAGVDPGATGGNLTHTHAAHSYTPQGTNSAPAFTGTSATLTGTIAWPASVPTVSGITVADHASHTHSVTSNVAVGDHASHTHTYTDVPNHTHVLNVQGGTTAATTGTHCMTSTATGGSARATTTGDLVQTNTGGVATGTTSGPSATLTHTVTNNAVTSGGPSATLTHTVSSQGTVAWPASVPILTMNAYTPAGTVAAPTFTGTAASLTHDTVNHEPPYYALAFIQKV